MAQPTLPTPATTSRPGEGSGLWLVKIATGPLLVLVIALHFTVNHFLGSLNGLLTYEEVLVYYQNPIIPAIEIIFLIAVVTHCLLGLRSILLDLNPSPKILTLANWVLSLLGVGVVVYGTWLALAIAAQGK